MKKQFTTAPTNSVLLVMDRSIGVVPESMQGGLVSVTSSCVAIGTRSEHDGETTILLSDEVEDASISNGQIVLDTILETPGKHLSVCTVLDEPLGELVVHGQMTRVRIWANDSTEPDEIFVICTPL